MSSRGSIVEGSVTSLTLEYLRDNPGGWTLEQVAEGVGFPRRHVYNSLIALVSSNRIHRGGLRPAHFRYILPVEPKRAAAEIYADAVSRCPLHALRAVHLEMPRLRPTGMPLSSSNRLLTLSFADQLRASQARRALSSELGSVVRRLRALRRGASASPWAKFRIAR